ncbi:MAG: hypothetical protein FWH17_02090 [Oscillospiraceae bacterium]|nr:hypothetical protein [Oscillospiraceae bacterium]
MGAPKAGGNVVATDDKQKNKQQIEKLSVLNEGSKESIFNLIFAESNGVSKKQ